MFKSITRWIGSVVRGLRVPRFKDSATTRYRYLEEEEMEGLSAEAVEKRIAQGDRDFRHKAFKPQKLAHLLPLDLRWSDLRYVEDLAEVLAQTDCTGALIDGANLRGVCLNNAVLARASLVGSNLSGTSLQGATLVGTSLAGANLNGVDLNRADLSAADFSEANLHRATLRGATIARSNFALANLSFVQFDGSNLLRCNFTGANLAWASVRDCNLNGCVWKQAATNTTDFVGSCPQPVNNS